MGLLEQIKTEAATNQAVADGLAAKDTVAIAAAMPPIVHLRTTHIGAGTIISVMGVGPTGGGKFIAALRAGASDVSTLPAAIQGYATDIKEMLPVIDRGDLDMSAPAIRGMVDAFAAVGMITAQQAVALKALAEERVPVNEFDVRRALWADDGAWLGV